MRRSSCPGTDGSGWIGARVASIIPFVCGLLPMSPLPAAATDQFAIPLSSFEDFEKAALPLLPEAIHRERKLWRQITPSVRWMLLDHADRLRALPPERQRRVVGEVAGFIVDARKKHASTVVVGPGRKITALLDPDQGLDPRQITSLAAAYGAAAEVLKRTGDASLAEVADAFLKAVAARVSAGGPATVVVVGHGLPKEIQSYHIPVDRLAAVIVEAGVRRDAPPDRERRRAVDLSDLVMLFDDCFSADFCLNLARGIRRETMARGASLESLPVLIAGANRDRYGLVDVGERFVTHYWDSVIELYYVRKPHPPAITLGDFQGHVDNFMYGYGRAPMFEGAKVVGYRLVDPRLVQDPVCFVPLSDDEVGRLRLILGMGPDEDLLPLLDAG